MNFIKKYHYSFFKILIPVVFFLVSPILFAGTITINSVLSINATCSNNGSITVNATEGIPVTGLFYSITDSTTQTNTSGIFTSLPAGTYYLKVYNLANDSAIQSNIIITSSYSTPIIERVDTIAPYCDNDVTGVLTGVRQVGTGLGSFLWRLDTITGATIRPFQASATFTNVPVGNYNIILQDCANTINYAIEFLPNGSEFSLGLYGNGFPTVEMIDCDTVMYRVIVNHLNKKFKSPYSLRITTPSGTHWVNEIDFTYLNSNANYLYISQKIGGVTYGDQIDVTVFNACNDSIKTIGRILNFNKFVAQPNLLCNDSLTVQFSLYDPLPIRYQTGLQASVNFKLIDSITGVVLLDSTRTRTQAQILTEQFGYESIYYINLQPIENNKTYIFRVTDGCGITYQDTFRFYVLPAPPYISIGNVGYICSDSVALFKNILVFNFKSLPTFQVLSGPSNVGSTQPLYAYNDTYTYPQNMFIYNVGNNTYNTGLSGLTAGKYELRFTDDCGTQLDTTIEIFSSEIKSLSHRFTYTKGCGNSNTIHFAADYGVIPDLRISRIGYGTVYSNIFEAFNAPNQISINNQPAGTYVVEFEFNGNYSGYALNDSKTCKRIYDTIIIPAETSPRITSHNVVKCSDNIVLELIADTSFGVPNYRYQLQDKFGVYTSIQNSNAFNVADTGNYKAYIIDSCGSRFVYNVFVDTLAFQPVFVGGLPCLGNSVELSLLNSPFVKYEWTLPNSTIISGNSITLNPILITDNGTYAIQRFIEIAGCKDTVTQFYNMLALSCTLPIDLVSFSADCLENQQIFSWQTASELNNHYFEIEQSTDAIHFKSIDKVYTKNGNSNFIQDYRFTYENEDIYTYFRLKQIDMDGQYSYSKVVQKNCKYAQNTISVYPNPATNQLNLDWNSINGNKTIQIYNTIGQEVISTTSDFNNIKIDISSLPASIYIVQLSIDGVMYKSQKFLKEDTN